MDLLNISNDAFIRTTNDAHKAAVQVNKDESVMVLLLHPNGTLGILIFLGVPFSFFAGGWHVDSILSRYCVFRNATM